MVHRPVYAPLRLAPGRSRLLMGLLLAVHALAVVVIPATPLPWWGLSGLLLLWGTSLYHGLWFHAWRRAPAAIAEAGWDELGRWQLVLVSGRRLDARLMGDSLVTVPLVILNFRVGRLGLRSLVLTADSLDPDTLRRLRVRLNLAMPEQGEEHAPG